MKKFLKIVFIALFVGLIAAAVASIVSKKKLESMSDDEIREYLGLKLAGRVGDDQLVTIQDAVVSGVRGKRAGTDHYVEDVEDALLDIEEVAEEAADDAVEQVADIQDADAEVVEEAAE